MPVVERWVLAVLRHRTFFSLASLNAAIAELLERLNARLSRKLPGSRRFQFEQFDRPLRPPARHPLRLRRVEDRPRAHRLPRRGRPPLLLRLPGAVPTATRRPTDRPHRRVLLPRPAHRQPRPVLAPGAPHHRGRAHAGEASPDGRVDARALRPLGREGRTADRRPDHHRARTETPPAAGLPLLPRGPAAGQVLRRRPPGGGRRPSRLQQSGRGTSRTGCDWSISAANGPIAPILTTGPPLPRGRRRHEPDGRIAPPSVLNCRCQSIIPQSWSQVTTCRSPT